ncbi:fimbrial protein [Klebsiella oxytoca]|uniref:S-fimbrial protein subunit SfaH n=1 Tax=Klebsiella oxytoca TaxID=571 RepID=A0A6N3EYD0_KLEOX|nr:fimbrial protein [Klebsiella oxytoca]AWF35664.1 protein FimH [Klebsiella oxytoca]EGT3581711.1 fimbrial protein [Klebsiella oxytoca]EHG8281437.1 fimbrial protein [Klebsiella oxytoca]EIY2867580.1 fimbrial protein [Klebsiella oxytoca]EKQ7196165.1 fimbrial protein [Klebsiella oxytoca]
MQLIRFIRVFIIASVAQLVWINGAGAFTCYDSTGNTVTGKDTTGNVVATSNVYVSLQPSIAVGQNLVVDLSSSIFCKNDFPDSRNDLVSMLKGSAYGGVLANFTGTMKYYGSSYSFPLTSATGTHNFTSGSYTGWNTQLYLTPLTSAASAAGGVAIQSGTLFAQLVMYQVGSNKSDGGSISTATFTWNLYASNSVVVPTGGCDVSARNVTVTLPEYPGNAVAVPLTVNCAENQSLSFYLTGTTSTSTDIFSNTYTGTTAASGVGIQLLRNGSAIPANQNISLGTVGTSAVSLGLTANYARTSGQVTAGGVQSIIGVNFVYD